jgi:hypothetical protein
MKKKESLLENRISNRRKNENTLLKEAVKIFPSKKNNQMHRF